MKQKRTPPIRVIILVFIIAVLVVGYLMWNKPRRNIAAEQGVIITASQLVKEYQANETTANAKYLDKAIEVTGVVSEIDKNQDGKTTLMITSSDPMTSVFCTLKEADGNVSKGSTVTVKGFCSGMLSDVRLREAIVVKP